MALTDSASAAESNPTLVPAVDPDRDASDRELSTDGGRSSEGKATSRDESSPVRRQVSHRVQGLLMRARRFTPSVRPTTLDLS